MHKHTESSKSLLCWTEAVLLFHTRSFPMPSVFSAPVQSESRSVHTLLQKHLPIFHPDSSTCSVMYFVVKQAQQMETEEQLHHAGLQPTVAPCMFLLNLICTAFDTHPLHCYFSCSSKNNIQEFLCDSIPVVLVHCCHWNIIELWI